MWDINASGIYMTDKRKEKRFVFSDGTYVAFDHDATCQEFVRSTGRTDFDHVEYWKDGQEVNSWNF